jgi:U3 small nucleolar RNA-associated protein 25
MPLIYTEDNYDFLSSLEVVLVDQADVFHMQNWNHLVWLFERLNKLPTDKANTEKTDFSRIRLWYLDGHSKYYRHVFVLFSFFIKFSSQEEN